MSKIKIIRFLQATASSKSAEWTAGWSSALEIWRKQRAHLCKCTYLSLHLYLLQYFILTLHLLHLQLQLMFWNQL